MDENGRPKGVWIGIDGKQHPMDIWVGTPNDSEEIRALPASDSDARHIDSRVIAENAKQIGCRLTDHAEGWYKGFWDRDCKCA